MVLAALTVAAVAHHCATWSWYIEDAAISFAYAKHLAMGEGLVPFIGGERVEGYSNPAWVLFLAPFSFVGLDLHESVRWLQVLLCIPTVGVVFLAAREALGPDSDGRAPHAALVAPALMAASSQFAMWGGAGLEMALMSLLMALALWRSLVEAREPQRWPWSAALWVGVALSRPEAILYAAVAGFCAMLFHLMEHRTVVPTIKWLLTFFVPFGLYHAWRYSYFAWAFPNTYYAKLERRPELPLFDWHSKPWNYTKAFLSEMGVGLFLPVWVLGGMGHRAWRTGLAVAICVGVGLLAELTGTQRGLLLVLVASTLAVFWGGLRWSEQAPPRGLAAGGLGVAVALVALSELLRQRTGMAPNPVPAPEILSALPPYVLLALGVALPLFGLGTPRWYGRALAWWLCMAAVLFALIAQWDWMVGYRWFAPAVVPAAVLFALGAASLARIVSDMLDDPAGSSSWLRNITLLLLCVALLPANVVHTQKVVASPQTSPQAVRKRVRYVDSVRDRLHVRERWRDLDVDQGAHLYWSDFEMIDIAGLVDVPLAHHKFEHRFLREYVFEQMRPHLVHLHGSWATNSRLLTFPEFRKDYLGIPGYPAGPKFFHPGHYVRRDLIVGPRYEGEPRRVALAGGVVLHGVTVQSEPAVAEQLTLELGLSSTKPRKTAADDVRLWMFLTNGSTQHLWELPPGYDWLPASEWKPHEVFEGTFTLTLPDHLTPGSYDLGLVFVAADGTILAPLHQEDAQETPVVAKGEVRLPAAVTLVTSEQRDLLAESDRRASLEASAEGRCDEAAAAWESARRHHAGDATWAMAEAPEVRGAMASCWARTSDTATTRQAQIAALVRARELDHWHPDYRSRARALADTLYAEGLTARAQEDWERAHRLFSDAVAVDRTRSWARRRAEEARARR
ncbi:MAG: glycosyltransferase family 39 protein [Myxococcales bacterium]|nr:glycosyltransferase family 39 protein [Myxococcales bacterium]